MPRQRSNINHELHEHTSTIPAKPGHVRCPKCGDKTTRTGFYFCCDNPLCNHCFRVEGMIDQSIDYHSVYN